MSTSSPQPANDISETKPQVQLENTAATSATDRPPEPIPGENVFATTPPPPTFAETRALWALTRS